METKKLRFKIIGSRDYMTSHIIDKFIKELKPLKYNLFTLLIACDSKVAFIFSIDTENKTDFVDGVLKELNKICDYIPHPVFGTVISIEWKGSENPFIFGEGGVFIDEPNKIGN